MPTGLSFRQQIVSAKLIQSRGVSDPRTLVASVLAKLSESKLMVSGQHFFKKRLDTISQSCTIQA